MHDIGRRCYDVAECSLFTVDPERDLFWLVQLYRTIGSIIQFNIGGIICRFFS